MKQMEITTTTLGYGGLAAVAVIAILLARPWRATTNRFGRRPASIRPGRPGSTDWFASDPVLFVGAGAASAECSAAGDGGGGGGSCD